MLGTDTITTTSAQTGDIVTTRSISSQTGIINQLTTDILYAGQCFFSSRPRVTTNSLNVILGDSFIVLSDVIIEILNQLTIFKNSLVTFDLGIIIGLLTIQKTITKTFFNGPAMFNSLSLENSNLHFTTPEDFSNKIRYDEFSLTMFYLSNSHMFSTTPKTTMILPTLPNQLCIKSYVDQNLLLKTGTNIFSGANSFSQIPILTGSFIPSLAAHLTSKSYVDNEIEKIKINSNTFSGNNTFTAVNNFNMILCSQIPELTGSYIPSIPAHLTSKSYVDTEIGKIRTGNNTFSGDIIFTKIPALTTTLTPISDTDLTTKFYVDNSIQSLKTGNTIYTGANTYTGNITFDRSPLLNLPQTSAATNALVSKGYLESWPHTISSRVTFTGLAPVLSTSQQPITNDNELISNLILEQRIFNIYRNKVVTQKWGRVKSVTAGNNTVYFNSSFPYADNVNNIVVTLTLSNPTDINILYLASLILCVTSVTQTYFSYDIVTITSSQSNYDASRFTVNWTAIQGGN